MAVDVGNTNTVFALMEDGQVKFSWRISTIRQRTADEYALALFQLMSMEDDCPRRVDDVLISSVVPQANFPLQSMISARFGLTADFVTPDIIPNMEIRMPNPREVGADRLVNSLGAHQRYGGPLIIVDFGTATTFDLVSRDGAYCGGVISPGINLSLEALHMASAQLPRIAISRPEKVIGDTTLSAMVSGIYWGYIGVIDGIAKRMADEYGESCRVIATGGLAPLFENVAESIDVVDQDLTVSGLWAIHKLRQAT